MKKLLIISITTVFCFNCLLSASEKPMMVFLVAGQSNMEGKGKSKDLPKEMLQCDGVWNYTDTDNYPAVFKLRMNEKKGRKTRFWDYHQQKTSWKPYLIETEKFGPEVNFVQEIKKKYPDRKIGIIKFAVGGSSLNRHWFNEKGFIQAGGPLYPLFIKNAKKAMSEQENSVLTGMIWFQGESDRKESDYPHYEKHFKNLINGVRKELNTPSLPFIYARINAKTDKETETGHQEIRRIQEKCSLANTAWIDIDDVTLGSDKVHYREKGYLKIGKRFSQKLVEMIKKQDSINANTTK